MSVVSDSFDRANSASLGSNWAEDSGDWEINTNALRETAAGAYYKCRWVGAALDSNNYAVEAVCQTSSDNYGSGVFGRGAASATVTYYALCLFGTAGVYLVEITAGAESIIGSYGTGFSNSTNYTLRLECDGSAQRCYVNGTQRITGSDATLSSGAVGVMSYGGGSGSVIADTWQAYDLGGGAVVTHMPSAFGRRMAANGFQPMIVR